MKLILHLFLKKLNIFKSDKFSVVSIFISVEGIKN